MTDLALKWNTQAADLSLKAVSTKKRTHAIRLAGAGKASAGNALNPGAGDFSVEARVKREAVGVIQPVVCKANALPLQPTLDLDFVSNFAAAAAFIAAHGSVTRSTTAMFWGAVPKYLSLTGLSVATSTPDTAAVSVTGDVDFRMRVALGDWTPVANVTLAAKRGGSASWILRILTTGKIALLFTTDGSTFITAVSSVAPTVSDGQFLDLKITRDRTSGVVKFYTASDWATWTQLGTDVVQAAGDIFDTTSPIDLGYNSTTGGAWAGKLARFELRSGIAGTLVAKFDAEDGNPSSTSIVSSATGETWTLGSVSKIVGAELQTAVVDSPRQNIDPVSLAPLGLLVEPTRTNMLPRSADPSDATWTKASVSVVAAATLAPTGALTACKLVEDTTASTQHRITKQASGTLSLVAYTLSVVAKAAERSQMKVELIGTAFPSGGANFDLAAGTVTLIETNVASASITPLGGGWFRCSITKTCTNTAGIATASVSLRDNANSLTYTGDGSSGLFLWNHQMEQGIFFTSDVVTAAAAAIRNSDLPKITDLSSFGFSDIAGTFVVEVQSGGDPAVADQRFICLSDGGGAERMLVYRTAARGATLQVRDDNVNTASLFAGTLGDSAFGTIAAAWAQDSFAVSLNGAAVALDSSGTLPTVNTLTLGTDPASSSNACDGHIRRLRYYPKRLTNTALQLLSGGGSFTAPLGWRLYWDAAGDLRATFGSDVGEERSVVLVPAASWGASDIERHLLMAVKRSGGSVSIFRDGVPIGTPLDVSGFAGSLSSSGDFKFGESPDAGQHFTGTIDEARFYLCSLTAAEAAEHARGLFAGGDESTLAGAWNFDEGRGAIAHDASGAGRYLALTNATWVVTGEKEIATGSVDLELSDGLESAVLLALFTDRRAEASDTLPDSETDRRGWWGDAEPVVEGDRIGSRLWLLAREKETQAVVTRAEEYAREALQWLVDDLVAEKVEVTAEVPAPGVLGLAVAIHRPQLDPVEFRFNYAWEAQEEAP
jgi:phage gp46-like protein